MANLQSIFKESGLQGIVPYGFDLDGPGYRFLCDKLREGISFYVVAEPETGLPYYFVDSNHVYFNLYSTEEAAAAKCDEIAMNKRYSVPALLETNGWADALWKRYRDLGATHVRLDDAVWTSMKDLAPIATYEGIISFETPLRNPTLNSIMYCYRQDVQAECCTDAMVALFWETFKRSTFYAPLRPTRTLHPGESLNAENSDFHYLTMNDGRKAFLLFTDDEFKMIYGAGTKLSSEEYKVVNVFNYDEIREFFADVPGLCAVVNAGCGGGFSLTPESIDEFESVALNQAALQKSSAPQGVRAMTGFFQNEDF